MARDPGNEILLANGKHALGKTRHFWMDLLHTLHDQGSGSAAVHLKLGEAVHVGVIPIQARRLVRRNRDLVLEARRTRLNQGGEHIVLMAIGRNIHAVKMDVVASRVRGPPSPQALPAGAGIFHSRINILNTVFDPQDQRVTLMYTQRRGFHVLSIRILIVVAKMSVAILIDRVPHDELRSQNTVLWNKLKASPARLNREWGGLGHEA